MTNCLVLGPLAFDLPNVMNHEKRSKRNWWWGGRGQRTKHLVPVGVVRVFLSVQQAGDEQKEKRGSTPKSGCSGFAVVLGFTVV